MTGLQIDQTLTDGMVQRALEECANRHYAGDLRRARRAIREGQCAVCASLRDNLTKQISAYLGRVDQTVKAIYAYQPQTPPQQKEALEQTSAPMQCGINLVVWVKRKSAALRALVQTLEPALAASQRELGCQAAQAGCYTLDVTLVDDRQVRAQRGAGLFVKHPHLASRLIWQRSEQPAAPPTKPAPAPEGVIITLPASFDPELIPESRLLEHALAIEKIPAAERENLEPRLTELKVILIRRMISDQLAYINIARRWFSASDLATIYQHRIGFGRIGGKSAGMLLAERILREVADEEVLSCLQVPESYFLGSELIYIFMAMNGLMYWNNQKYKPEEQIWAEYPLIQKEFQAGSFPPEILVELQELLTRIGKKPLIVRSSSQLEDNFGTSFAGKYDSYFCPNQGSPEENLAALTNAIARTYASTLKPEALLYRRSKGLQDYDERMAVLIQVVQGEKFGRYYLPHGAGVAFSRNIYRWSPQIKREAGFVRLVWGLGTRAVQRLGDDYPRLVALSHPTLQPDDSTTAIRRYSQKYVDLIDLEDNAFKTLPVHEVLQPDYPPLRLVAQLEKEGFFITPRMRVRPDEVPNLAITYHELLKRTPFAHLLSQILRLLEEHYHATVDMEFTLHLPDPRAASPRVQINLLQCRPQSQLESTRQVRLPADLPEEDILFSTRYMVPQGYLPDIRHVIFVKPEAYFRLATPAERREIGQVVSRLNAALEQKSFIAVGPGRWGSLNLDLGVYVSYADIHNAGALVELSGQGVGPAPEPSLGTHFFQDLMEAQIYPLALSLDEEGVQFNRDFFYQSPNAIGDFLEVEATTADCVRLIAVGAYRPGYHVEVVMDDEQGEAVAFFVQDKTSGELH